MGLAIFSQIGHATADGVENILVVPLLPSSVGFEIHLKVGISYADRPGQFPLGGIAVLTNQFPDRPGIKLSESYSRLSGYGPQPLGDDSQTNILSDLGKVVFLDDKDYWLFLGNQTTDDSFDMSKHRIEGTVLPDCFNAVVG